jgi:hypothetical protein
MYICGDKRMTTYIAAKPIIELTRTFARVFIWRSFTMKMGKMPKVQSAKEFNPETMKVKIMTSEADRQVPLWFGSRSHQNEMGLHWNITRRVYETPKNAATIMIIRMIQTWSGTMVMRNKKSPTAILSIDVAMV